MGEESEGDRRGFVEQWKGQNMQSSGQTKQDQTSSFYLTEVMVSDPHHIPTHIPQGFSQSSDKGLAAEERGLGRL